MIVVEDLAVRNMVRNRSLAKAIGDCGWGTFRQMLEYKAARAGRHLIVISRWYLSCQDVLGVRALAVKDGRPSAGGFQRRPEARHATGGPPGSGALSPPQQHPAIMARVAGITTRGEARQYLEEVAAKTAAASSARGL